MYTFGTTYFMDIKIVVGNCEVNLMFYKIHTTGILIV